MGAYYSSPQECPQSFSKGSSGPESKGPSWWPAGLTHCPKSLWRRGGEYREHPLSFSNVWGVGQLGLKPHETQHLAPEAASPTPDPVSINTAQMAPRSLLPDLPLQARP